jgi:glycosyltransferase involved in cell wall biosynthesis
MASLLIDVTEFVTNPIRTGIQRVIRELLGLWPHDTPMQVVWFDDRIEGLAPVPDELLTVLIEAARDPYFDDERLKRKSLLVLAEQPGTALTVGRSDRVMIPELFASSARARFYRRLQERGVSVRAIVYDILAWTQPDALNITTVGPFNDYIAVLRGAEARAHISQAVCDDYTGRILRRKSDAETVIVLGADALGERPEGMPVKPQLVAPGALDGRKGQDRIYDAYLALPEKARLPLIIAGRVPPTPRDSMRRILESGCPTVSVIDDPDDAQLKALVAGAQGCLFPSQFEGFGLPARESLYLGTPVVVDARLPAVSDLPPAGQIRLESQDHESMVQALMRISDRKTAARLREEVTTLRLPTWAAYARQVATWASA